jgi:hypothetical protein
MKTTRTFDPRTFCTAGINGPVRNFARDAITPAPGRYDVREEGPVPSAAEILERRRQETLAQPITSAAQLNAHHRALYDQELPPSFKLNLLPEKGDPLPTFAPPDSRLFRMAPTTAAELNELHRRHYADPDPDPDVHPAARGFSPQDLRKAEIMFGKMPGGEYRERGLEEHGLEAAPESMSARELLAKSREYWGPNTLPVTRDRAPITLAELNERNREFWARRSR